MGWAACCSEETELNTVNSPSFCSAWPSPAQGSWVQLQSFHSAHCCSTELSSVWQSGVFPSKLAGQQCGVECGVFFPASWAATLSWMWRFSFQLAGLQLQMWSFSFPASWAGCCNNTKSNVAVSLPCWLGCCNSELNSLPFHYIGDETHSSIQKHRFFSPWRRNTFKNPGNLKKF